MPQPRMLQMTNFVRAYGALLRRTLHLQLLYWYPVSSPLITCNELQPCYHTYICDNTGHLFINSWCEFCKRVEWPASSPWFPCNPGSWQPYIFSSTAACQQPCALSGDNSRSATTHACQSAGRPHKCFIKILRVLFKLSFYYGKYTLTKLTKDNLVLM